MLGYLSQLSIYTVIAKNAITVSFFSVILLEYVTTKFTPSAQAEQTPSFGDTKATLAMHVCSHAGRDGSRDSADSCATCVDY